MPFRKYNYAIPQVMPHAIPQTHSPFLPSPEANAFDVFVRES